MVKKNPKSYPKTYLAETGGIIDSGRTEIFDPALKQYPCAFRLAPPEFDTPQEKSRWRNARVKVIGHLLKMVAESPWSDSLVLRGSVLLRFWLGDEARDPGDIDWVVRPASVELSDPAVNRMFDAFIHNHSIEHCGDGVAVGVKHIAVEDIWTYDRAPGKRIVFPWHVNGRLGGAVQMDFVFGEAIYTVPELIQFDVDGTTIPIWAATPEESLAWKLLWLETDAYPQGKDLFDATLLAEHTRLPWNLLRRVLQSDPWLHTNKPGWEMFTDGYVDWDDFLKEYPRVQGDASVWQNRLRVALANTLAEGERDAWLPSRESRDG